MRIVSMTRTSTFHALLMVLTASSAAAQVTAIRAGGLVDPDAGTVSTNQIILIEDGRFRAIGADVTIPRGAEVIDLSHLTVLPGLVDAHNHLALTYKAEPENNIYYLTYVLESTPLREPSGEGEPLPRAYRSACRL